MPERWIRPACVAMLAGTWVVDLVTPQRFVAAILFNGPIALSSLALDTRFTRILVGLALVASAFAGYQNGLVEGHWDGVALANRVVAALSYLLVAGLGDATRRSAARAGELAARQERAARERSVRHAVESIRESVNPELIRRAIPREACAALAVDEARFYAFKPSLDEPATYVSECDDEDVREESRRPEAPVLSLLHRIADRPEGVTAVLPTDALGRLLLDVLGAPYAVAAPLVEHETVFGVLFVLRRTAPFEPQFEEGLAYLVDQAAIALAQASLFAQLGERNREIESANVALRERGDVIRDIVYALSHDLRTPLSAARMTLQQALDGAYGELPAAYREILRRTIESNDELQRLAETLLLVARYESGDHALRRERVDLSELAREVLGELEPLWRDKGLAVTLDADGEHDVFGDARELRRALVNLLANAITWTPAGRSIAVALRERGRTLEVSIADEGYGVPEAERADLFARVRTTPSRRGAGSGLGLYLVRRIAESHDGTVSYEARDGGGSVFRLALPLAAAPALAERS